MSSNLQKLWIEDMTKMVKMSYPKISEDKIVNMLEVLLKENKDSLKNESIELIDTYRNVKYKSDMTSIFDFCNDKKVLMAGNGVLLDRDKRNPAINMLHDMGDKRKAYKKQMYASDADSYEFNMFNLKQNNEKVKRNAW